MGGEQTGHEGAKDEPAQPCRLSHRKKHERSQLDSSRAFDGLPGFSRRRSAGDRERPPTHPAAFTMSKIGRYMATTMPPTTMPRNTIISGSIIASWPETAASTSSS